MALEVHVCWLNLRIANDRNLQGERPMPNKPSVLITGTSSGIGTVYAERYRNAA
jgi:hypothetical protein